MDKKIKLARKNFVYVTTMLRVSYFPTHEQLKNLKKKSHEQVDIV